MILASKIDGLGNRALVDAAFDYATLADQPVIAATSLPAGYADISGPRAGLIFAQLLDLTAPRVREELLPFTGSWATLSDDDKRALLEQAITPEGIGAAELDALYSAQEREAFACAIFSSQAFCSGLASNPALQQAIKMLTGSARWIPTAEEEIAADLRLIFTPEDLSVSGPLATWRGRIAGRDGVQTIAARMPTVVLGEVNGFAAVDFADAVGTEQYYVIQGARGLLRNVGGVTVFVVLARGATQAGQDSIFQVNGGTGGTRLQVRLGTSPGGELRVGARRLDTDSFTTLGDPNLAGTGYELYTVQVDYANATATLWRNGVQVAQDTTFLTAGNTSDTDADKDATMGTHPDLGANFLQGRMAGFRLYAKTLSTADRQRREGMLRWKFLTPALPTGHPYETAAP